MFFLTLTFMTTIDEILNPKTPFEGELLLQHLENPFFFLFPEFYEGEKAKLAEAALYVSKEIYLYLFEYFKRNYESAESKVEIPKGLSLEQFFLSSIEKKGFPSKTPEQLKLEVEGLSYNNKLLQFFKEYFFPGVLDSTGIVFDEYFYSNLLQKVPSKESGKNYELVSLFRRMYAIKMPQRLYEFLLNTGSFNPPSNKKAILVPIISTQLFYTDSDYNIALIKKDGDSDKYFFLANLGFYIYEDTIVVNQIQGRKLDDVVYEKYAEAMKNIEWSKVLLGTIVNIAEEFKLKLKVISAQNHILTKIPGHLSYRRAGMIYNATAKALGFKKDIDGNYILSF